MSVLPEFKIDDEKHKLYIVNIPEIEESNIGAFIGKKGVHFNNIIKDIKQQIIGKSEITDEEWSELDIRLRFNKDKGKISASVGCKESEIDIIRKVIRKSVSEYKKEEYEYKNRENYDKHLLYRIGADYKYISDFIGICGSNISFLKQKLMEIENLENIKWLEFKEQTFRINTNYTNIGFFHSKEHILLNITLEGKPDFKIVQKVIEDYVDGFIHYRPKDYFGLSDTIFEELL